MLAAIKADMDMRVVSAHSYFPELPLTAFLFKDDRRYRKYGAGTVLGDRWLEIYRGCKWKTAEDIFASLKKKGEDYVFDPEKTAFSQDTYRLAGELRRLLDDGKGGIASSYKYGNLRSAEDKARTLISLMKKETESPKLLSLVERWEYWVSAKGSKPGRCCVFREISAIVVDIIEIDLYWRTASS